MNTTTAGDLGDIVVMLGTLNAIDEEHTVLLRDNGQTKGIVKRERMIRSLIEAQGHKCRPYKKGDEVDWASEEFRQGFHRSDDTLFNSHATHAVDRLGIPLPDHATLWLHNIQPRSEARVVISRSVRYNNPYFPWRTVLDTLEDAIFVGIEDEHAIFQNTYGVKIRRRPTKDLLEVAELIAGSELFIGNQSSPMTIAEGLKHPRIQETCLHVADCVYPADGGNQYVPDGCLNLPGYDLTTQPVHFDVRRLDLRHVPRKGWVATLKGVTETQSRPELTAKYLSRKTGEDYEVAFRETLEQTLAREPQFFRSLVNTNEFATAARALRNAGWTDHPTLDITNGRAPFYVS